MFRPVRALLWEILWKNRIVAPALAGLFGIGVWMISAAIQAHSAGLPEQASYYPRSIAMMAFVTSLLLIYAPFTLMEGQSGWRMNSMTSRWFVLPIRTWILVAVPFLLGYACVAIIAGAWWLPLKKYIPLEDFECVLALLCAMMGVVQAVAWATPGKPRQFWICIVLVGYAFLWFVFVRYLHAGIEFNRNQVLTNAMLAIISTWAFAYGFGILTRRGIWPGYFKVPPISSLLPWKRRIPRRLGGAQSALYWSETVPIWKSFGLSWLGLVILAAFAIWLKIHNEEIVRKMGNQFIIMTCYNTLPVLAVAWLSPLAIAAGCASPGVSWTRMSPYLAMQPINSGALVQARLMGILLAWLIVWLPFLIFGPVYQTVQDNPGDMITSSKVYSMLGWLMVISAHAGIGFLPLLLWGRLEGLPTLILVLLGSLFATWQLAGWLRGGDDYQPALWLVGGLLGIKLISAIGFLTYSFRKRQISWKFAIILPLIWLVIGGALALVSWRDFGVIRAMAVLILLPLVRPALCPGAVALNRHR